MLNADLWSEEFSGWLESFAWLWFCSLTFRPGFTDSRAKRYLRHWMLELKKGLGTEDFSWVSVPENGTTRLDFHFHALVGGLRAWHANERVMWMRKWGRQCGNALITKYNPNKCGVRYILKTVTPENAEKVEFEISSRIQVQTIGAK